MKKINQLAAAVAVALSMTATPQVSAEIEFHPNGRGDALLFPVFNGYIENYFTIMNSHNKYIQGHLRFRGAAWSGELRDFDVILSPGDVFVFRVADIDGDGIWEIDQSLDIKNFQYTGLGGIPGSKPDDPNTNFTCSPFFNTDIKITQCMDPSDKLIPNSVTTVSTIGSTQTETFNVPQAVIDYHMNMGYVEFIGEAVLEGLDYNIMEILLGSNPGSWQRHQTKMFSGRGTNAWMWSDAGNGFALDHGLSDVPNALSGTAFLTIPGVGHGLAYNAEALVNFRTDSGDSTHRIENYPHSWQCLETDSNDKCTKWGVNIAEEDTSVILHHENAASDYKAGSPAGDYVYGFDRSCISPTTPTAGIERCDESRISFNNTWGPTLADGDDYDLVGLRPNSENSSTGAWDDDWDDVVTTHGLGIENSIAEVEEAIRLGIATYHADAAGGPQVFTAYYMDGDIFDKSCEGNGSQFPYNKDFCPDPPPQSRAKPAGATTLSTLTSYYLAFFPTKFFYGERSDWYNAVNLNTYIVLAVDHLLKLPKPVYLEVWDIFEKTGKVTQGGGINCISPATPEDCAVQGPGAVVFGYELNFLSIRDLKKWIAGGTSVEDFLAGRVVVEYPSMYNNPLQYDTNLNNYDRSWPGLMYTFEWDGGPTLTNWRPMHRIVYQ